MTVACPDAPLWQVGGFTFGRHQDPDGRVPRARPTLIAWLTNNYWMTNFQADQGGRLRFRFWLVPGRARALGDSVQDALSHSRPLAAHVFAGRGEVRQAAGTLLRTDFGPLILTRLEAAGQGIALTLLNPEDRPVDAVIRAGSFRPTRAWRTSLDGERQDELRVDGGEVRQPVAARAWTRLELDSA
jgi:hypothetical protein